MSPIRILIVEDHDLVRAGFCALLNALDDVTIVGQARTGYEALDLAASCAPKVVLMDISLPGLNGLEVTRRIAEAHPHIRVLILSVHTGEEYVLQALRAGAAGYLVKDSGADELAMAVRSVAEGRTYLSPQVSRHVIDRYLERQQDLQTPFERLTPRQREILQMIAEGATTRDMARRLKLSVKTVDTHRTQLMDRLDIHDVAGLVRYAIRTGLVDSGK